MTRRWRTHVFWQRAGRDIWEGVDVTEVRDATTIGAGAEANLMRLLDVASCFFMSFARFAGGPAPLNARGRARA